MPVNAQTLADLAGQYAIKRVEIYREHHKGISYLVFQLDTQWEGDSPIVVVYHPDKPLEWTTGSDVYCVIEPGEK